MADASMDEILERIQRAIALEDAMKEGQPADSLPPTAGISHRAARDDRGGGAAPGATTEQLDRLLSPATAGAAAAAFTQIAIIRRQQRRIGEFPIGGEQRTIEDVVRELLQPLMHDWLEEKATPIVERLVRAEVARALGEVEEAK